MTVKGQVRHQLVLTDGEGRSRREITPSDENADSPSFSPDGQRIAYVASEGRYESAGPNQHRIWVVQVDGTGPVRITGPPAGSDEQTEDAWSDTSPDWSPTRNEILYRHTGRSLDNPLDPKLSGEGLYVVVPGGEPRLLRAGPMRPGVWSADGEQVAFDQDGSIWIVARNGSGLRQVAASNHDAISWAPDGGSLYLSGGIAGNEPPPLNGFRRVDLTTGEVTPLGPRRGALAWAPDGERIYSIDTGPDGRDRLTVTKLVDGQPQVTTKDPDNDGLARLRNFDVASCG